MKKLFGFIEQAPPLYVGVEGAERLTGLRGGQISRALKSGDLRGFRVGKRICVKLEDLTSWVEKVRFQKEQH